MDRMTERNAKLDAVDSRNTRLRCPIWTAAREFHARIVGRQ